MSRSRRHAFTWHVPDTEAPGEGLEHPFLLSPEEAKPAAARYVVAGFEVCPDTHRPHLQGYVEWENGKSISAAAQALGLPGVHLEIARGTAEQNKQYCKKDGDFFEVGEAGTQGQRSDLLEVKRLLDDGVSMTSVSESHFSDFIRYEKGFRSYRRLHAPKRNWPMELIFYIGPSGTGKTRNASDTYPDAYWKPAGKWWDGYDGQETVIVDEMYGHRFPFSDLLRLTDRYPYSVEVKGGVIEFTSRRIVFTSNQEPEDWYLSEKTHRGTWEESPLRRRIRDFGRVIYTGEVHRAQPPVLIGYDD